MGLGPLASLGARLLVNEFGYEVIEFTRGYSTLRGQARAMAKNVSLNRRWIEQTYTNPSRPSYAIAVALQKAVDTNPEVASREALERLIYEEMMKLPNASELSFHTKVDAQGNPAAEAFDLVPVPYRLGDQVKSFIYTLPNLDKFLVKEGGLNIWHVQFKEHKPIGEV